MLPEYHLNGGSTRQNRLLLRIWKIQRLLVLNHSKLPLMQKALIWRKGKHKTGKTIDILNLTRNSQLCSRHFGNGNANG